MPHYINTNIDFLWYRFTCHLFKRKAQLTKLFSPTRLWLFCPVPILFTSDQKNYSNLLIFQMKIPVLHNKGLLRSNSTLTLLSFRSYSNKFLLERNIYHSLMGMLCSSETFVTFLFLFSISDRVSPSNYPLTLRAEHLTYLTNHTLDQEAITHFLKD